MTIGAPIDQDDDDVRRLQRAEEEVRRAFARWRIAVRARNEVVIELRSEGRPRNWLARVMGCTPGLITKILAG